MVLETGSAVAGLSVGDRVMGLVDGGFGTEVTVDRRLLVRVPDGWSDAQAASVPLVFLEGAPGYYSRFGFEQGSELGFRKPSLRIPDAAFQVLRLPAYEQWMTGTLVYSEVFWRHDAVGLRES